MLRAVIAGWQRLSGLRGEDVYAGSWKVGAVDPMSERREWLSPYNYVQNNPVIRVDPDGAFDFVQNANGNIYWDKNANSQATTKRGETYLGTSLSFVFNSYIDENLWDGPMGNFPAGDKLVSTINVSGNEDRSGNLISIDVKSGEPDVRATGGIFPGVGLSLGRQILPLIKKE